MPIIHIPTPLQYYTNGQAEVTTSGKTVAEGMQQLFTEYETLKSKEKD